MNHSVQRKQSPDSGGEPLGPPLFVLLHVLMAVEQRAVSQPPARQALTQLFDHAGAGLEERCKRALGYFVNDDPSKRAFVTARAPARVGAAAAHHSGLLGCFVNEENMF